MKMRSSVKDQYTKQFNSALREMIMVPTDGDINQYYLFKYFTASASDSMHTYVLANYQPTGPDDLSVTPTDVLVAKVQAGYIGNVIPEVTTPDWIARTIDFIKELGHRRLFLF